MMKDFSGAGLKFDFLDDIFGDFFKGRNVSFSSKRPRGSRGVKFEAWPGREINLDEIFGQAPRQKRQNVRYELTITPQESLQGTKKTLTRKGKSLEVKIPAGVRTGSIVKLSNARQIIEGLPGDILIKVVVK